LQEFLLGTLERSTTQLLLGPSRYLVMNILKLGFSAIPSATPPFRHRFPVLSWKLLELAA